MRRFRSAIYVGSILVAVAVAFGAISADARKQEARLREQFDRAKRLGMPESPAELGYPMRDPGKNAAIAYERLREKGAFQAWIGATVGVFPENDREKRALEKALDPVRTDLAELERASRLPFCRIEERFTAGPNDQKLCDFLGLGVNILAARARLEAAGGDPVRAMRTLETAARITAHMGQTGTISDFLSQQKNERMVCRGLGEVLVDSGRRADVLAAARRTIDALGADVDIKKIQRTDWLTLKWIIDNAFDWGFRDRMELADTLGDSKLEQVRFALRAGTKAGRDEQEAVLRQAFLDGYESMPDDPSDYASAFRASRRIQTALVSAGSDAWLARMVYGPPIDAFAVGVRSNLRRRMFRLLLDCLDRPTPPSQLPANGKNALDPFSGKPFLYRAKPGSIVIYSVGLNEKDDGGRQDAKTRADDLVVRWPIAKTRPILSRLRGAD